MCAIALSQSKRMDLLKLLVDSKRFIFVQSRITYRILYIHPVMLDAAKAKGITMGARTVRKDNQQAMEIGELEMARGFDNKFGCGICLKRHGESLSRYVGITLPIVVLLIFSHIDICGHAWRPRYDGSTRPSNQAARTVVSP